MCGGLFPFLIKFIKLFSNVSSSETIRLCCVAWLKYTLFCMTEDGTFYVLMIVCLLKYLLYDFLAVPLGCLQLMIVVFTDHTHFLFLKYHHCFYWCQHPEVVLFSWILTYLKDECELLRYFMKSSSFSSEYSHLLYLTWIPHTKLP